MIKKIAQKSILTLVLAFSHVIVALEGQKSLDQAMATAQPFTAEDVKVLEERCLQTLNQILSLVGQDNTLTALDKSIKEQVTRLYNDVRARADSHVKNNEIPEAMRLLRGLYSRLLPYTNKSAWGGLRIASNPVRM